MECWKYLFGQILRPSPESCRCVVLQRTPHMLALLWRFQMGVRIVFVVNQARRLAQEDHISALVQNCCVVQLQLATLVQPALLNDSCELFFNVQRAKVIKDDITARAARKAAVRIVSDIAHVHDITKVAKCWHNVSSQHLSTRTDATLC